MEKVKEISGFTITEMVIVIVLLAILGATYSFRWSYNGFDLPNQVALLASDIRYTQNLAMTNGKKYSLVTLNNSSYQIQYTSGSQAIVVPNSLGSTTTTLASDVTFVFNPGLSAITFDTQGTPYYQNSVLTSSAYMTLTGNGQTKNVNIDYNTGRVTT